MDLNRYNNVGIKSLFCTSKLSSDHHLNFMNIQPNIPNTQALTTQLENAYIKIKEIYIMVAPTL